MGWGERALVEMGVGKAGGRVLLAEMIFVVKLSVQSKLYIYVEMII